MAQSSQFLKSVMLLTFLIGIAACERASSDKAQSITNKGGLDEQIFELLSSEQTKVNFQNTLNEGLNTNILLYEYFYNGGGVAIGDLNGDKISDLYFTSNMGDNKLYINESDAKTGIEIKYKDVTLISGAGGRPGPWKTGVSMIDINGDNKLDIYVSYSGAMPEEKRRNQLFINQGNNEAGIPLFIDEAASYGLDQGSFSSQAYFLDYDRDGDLDMLALNHNPKNLPILNETKTRALLKEDDRYRGVRLFKNQQDKFVDVTIQAGISSSSLTYGLGIGISDLDNDGWPDFYVSNDYAVPDYLYMNNKDGTFVNRIDESLGHISQFSMGNDISDINNDGRPDIITLDMLPEDNKRQKLLVAPDDYSKFDLNVRSGFHNQYMRNMLQLNNGDDTFSEIGQYAGISNTDWSWAALVADYDNDGYKDLYVTNGYNRDYTNLDFINYMEGFIEKKGRLKREDVLEIIKNMPASDVPNYIYKGGSDIRFLKMTKEWGVGQPANSNGAAYADLDNDGDLDIVVNNINKPAFVYENKSSDKGINRFLNVTLKGGGKNANGIGAKVRVYGEGKEYMQEQYPARGYLSSVSDVMHFGLGGLKSIDSVIVRWGSGSLQKIEDVAISSLLSIEENKATAMSSSMESATTVFEEVISPIAYQDALLEKRDFDRQKLLINQLSSSGPIITKGDLNNDGLEDVFIGGAAGKSASIFLQGRDELFQVHSSPVFEKDKRSHDADALIFDANQDGLNDIYVVSGGYHSFSSDDERLQDRLYINKGGGSFIKPVDALPKLSQNGGVVALIDVNNDGYQDLFIGGRVIPGEYPKTPKSFLFINNGQGEFRDETENFSKGLADFGMVTDAIAVDMNGDDKDDLIVVGEWTDIGVFINRSGKLINETSSYFESDHKGLWNQIASADFNNDGKPDFVLGNLGLNTQLHASNEYPLEMIYKDFDSNGSIDPMLVVTEGDVKYPYVTRDELVAQVASIKPKFTTYELYAEATVEHVFSENQLRDVERLDVNRLETSLFVSSSDGTYKEVVLPKEAQYAPIHLVHIFDFNQDSNLDLLLCGNDKTLKLRLGQTDANYGVLLEGLGNGGFKYVEQSQSGLQLKGDVKSMVQIDDTFIFGVNQSALKSYRLNKRPLN